MFLLLLKTLFFLIIGFSITCLGILYIFGSIPSIRRYKLIQNIPGPKGYFLFGNAIELHKAPHEDMLDWTIGHLKKYPRIMRVWLFGFSLVYLYDADDVQVLLSNTENITKGTIYLIFKSWLEEGLLTSTGDKWHTRRKMLTPAFHFKILEDNMPIFNKSSKALCDKFMSKLNEDIPIERYICDSTLDVITKAAMGINLEEEQEAGRKYVSEIKTISELVAHRMMSPILYNETIFALSPGGRRFKQSVGYLQKFSSDVIKRNKSALKNTGTSQTISSSGKVRRAFLDLMLEHEMKNPGALSDDGIREEVDTFMFEGHDTTSAALTFIFFNLARHQDIQEKVYLEQLELFEGSDRDATVNDLQRMVYLEKVIKESLRLYPSVAGISRLLEKDLVLIDGTIIPASTNIILPIFHFHMNEKYWPDPEKFDPERFSEDEIKGRHPYAYIPFSAGPRNCIGQKFAMMELKTIVSSVVRKLKILPVTKFEDIKLVLYLVLRTLDPIKCKFVLR